VPLPPPARIGSKSATGCWTFYAWCANARDPGADHAAETIETWRQPVRVFLQAELATARTEGTDRLLVKHVKRRGADPETGPTTAAGTRVRYQRGTSSIRSRSRSPFFIGFSAPTG
jgi:hypothetical protein